MSAAKCEACEEDFNEEQRKPRQLDCGCILCEKCLKGIYKFYQKFTCNKHNIITQRAIETLSILQNPRPQEFCQVHYQQLIALYCPLDKVRICIQCQQESHQGHECITEYEAIQRLKTCLESTFRAIKLRLDQYDSTLSQLQQRMDQEQISGRNKLFQFLKEVKQQTQQVFKEQVNEQQGQLEQQIQLLRDIYDQHQMIGSQIGIFENSFQDSINQYEYKKDQLNQFDISIQGKFQQISQANDRLSQEQFSFQNIEGRIIVHLMQHFQPNVVFQGQTSQASQIRQQQQVIRRQYQDFQEQQGYQQKVVQENLSYKEQMRILLSEQESLKSTLKQLEINNKTSSDQLKLKEKQIQELITSLEKYKSQTQQLKDFGWDEIVLEPIFKYVVTKRAVKEPPRISVYRRIFCDTNKVQSYQLDNLNKVCSYRSVSEMTPITTNCSSTYQIDDELLIQVGGGTTETYLNKILQISVNGVNGSNNVTSNISNSSVDVNSEIKESSNLIQPRAVTQMGYDNERLLYILGGVDPTSYSASSHDYYNYYNSFEVYDRVLNKVRELPCYKDYISHNGILFQ